MDLGMSSMQVDSTRGFSFRAEFNGDLDMRMSKSIQTTAKDIVNNYGERHLADIFQRVRIEYVYIAFITLIWINLLVAAG